MLGADPTADGEGIARLCSRLLEVWAGIDGAAKARRQEVQAAAAVLRQKIGGRLG